MELFDNITQNLNLSKQIIANKDSDTLKNNLKKFKKEKVAQLLFFNFDICATGIRTPQSQQNPSLLYGQLYGSLMKLIYPKKLIMAGDYMQSA